MRSSYSTDVKRAAVSSHVAVDPSMDGDDDASPGADGADTAVRVRDLTMSSSFHMPSSDVDANASDRSVRSGVASFEGGEAASELADGSKRVVSSSLGARDFLGEYVRELGADAVAEEGGGFTVAPSAGEDGGAAGSDALDDVRAQAVLEGERRWR
jgi:hypothetical protein